MRNFILAYCSENESTIKEMDNQLGKAGFEFQHISCDTASNQEPLAAQINAESSQNVVLLFISDNFLRSSTCMYKALLMLKNLNDSNRLLTIITDGQHTDPLTKKTSSSPTSFERVSNVIQYMNHWQEQYLAMRKQKRGIPPEQEQEFEDRLKVVRSISTEIGEFLRYLRSLDHVQYDELKENRYEMFFNATGNMGLYLDFKNKQPQPAPVEKQKVAAVPPPPVVEEKKEVAVPPPPVVEKKQEIVEPPQPVVEEKQETVEPPQPVIEETPPVVAESPTPTPAKQEEEPPVKEEEPVAEQEEEIMEEDVEELEIDEIPLEELINIQNEEEKHSALNANGIGSEVNKTPLVESSIPAEQEASPVEEENAVSEEEAAPSESSYELLQSLFDEEDEEDEDDDEEEDENDNSEEDEDDDEEGYKEEEIESTGAIVKHAKLLIDGGKVEEGLSFLNERVKEQIDNAELRYQYAEMLVVHKNDYAVATGQLETSLQHNAEHIPSHLLLAEIAESQEDLPTSIQHYNSVYKIYPTIPGLAYKLGSLKVNSEEDQDPKSSATLFKEALKLDPLNVDARYQYAVLLYEKLDKGSKAIKHLEETLRLQPDHPFANYDLALIHYKEGNQEKAASYYQKAYEANPELRTPANDKAFEYIPVAKAEKANPAVEALSLNTAAAESTTVPEPAIPEPEKEASPVIMITGATAGIGRATATLFAEKGYRLILTGRRMDKLEALKKDFKTQHKADCHILNFDVRDATAAKAAIISLPEELKNIDVLINNAGLAKGYAPIHEGDIDDWETMIDTNIKGLLYLTRAVSPHMVERRQGHIINICSSAGHEVYPNGNVYCATKYAVDALTKSMRLDLYKHNVRVSQVSPGHVEETEFALVRFDGDKDRSKIYEDFNPLKSKDVAEVIWFIATRPAYVNIQDIVVMGTQQAGNNHIDRSGRKE